ncbi:MAG: cytochrome c-type biogenesis protein CcmH [Phycisphaerales bacterium]|nr:cytochrome c-type biogenesis protein CcmH [Hyphomonadaceae bacterium]
MSFVAMLIAAAAPAILADPAQEARARALDAEIRCVQCENEPIAQSTADIAADMRRLVRERIAAGESDAEIRSFFRERYGDFVLFRPPWDARTWALWLAPIALLLAGFAALASARVKGIASELPQGPEESER